MRQRLHLVPEEFSPARKCSFLSGQGPRTLLLRGCTALKALGSSFSLLLLTLAAGAAEGNSSYPTQLTPPWQGQRREVLNGDSWAG